MYPKKQFFIECLHIFVLAGFALAQPVYDLLGQNPEFLVSHRASPLLIISLALLLSFGIPLAFCLLKLLLLPLGHRLQQVLHQVIVFSLMVLILLPLARRLLPGDGLILAASLLAAGVFTGLYAGWRPVSSIMSVLSPAIIIFPLWFLLLTPVSRLAMPQDVQALSDAEINEPAPVILVVLDEINTRALLDEKGRIDEVRFPNFARLADQSYWFPNALGPHIQTMHALPAILTGRMSQRELNPTAADHPQNLFTLLGREFNINALEAETNLCPQNLCTAPSQARTMQQGTFWSDLGIIYLHIISPPEYANRLPMLDGQWTGFAHGAMDQEGQSADQPRTMDRRGEEFKDFVAAINSDQDRHLHFLHTLLPHLPYRYLSTGHVYNRSINHAFPEGIKDEGAGWSHKRSLVRAGYLQYLQQTGYTDHLIGRLLQQLKSKDMYDKSLIIVTADHGVAFQPGLPRRGLTPETVRDVLKLPMLVKLPDQEQGQIREELVSGLDILPTIADVLDIELTWEVHGRSMFDENLSYRDEVELFDGKSFSLDDVQGFPRLDWQIKHFGSGSPLYEQGTRGPFADLMGKELSELSVEHSEQMQFKSEMIANFQQVDPESGFLPALFSGHVTGTDELDLPLAVALNGRIVSTTTSSRWLQMERYFAALLPASDFEPGSNDIQLFMIVEKDDEPVLDRIPGVQGDMDAVKFDGHGDLELDADTRISLTSSRDEVRGYVDHFEQRDNTLTIQGWAGDKQYKPVKRVLFFHGQDLLAETRPRIQRKDVARHFNQESLLHSGFQIQVPFDPEQDDLSQIRVIAVSQDKKARELSKPDQD